jgi:predicted peroxiredoxin
MTRCAIAFFQGNFASAMQWNPLIFVTFCGFSIFDGYALAVVVTRAPRFRIRVSNAGAKYVRGVVAGALVLNWIYLLVHWQRF